MPINAGALAQDFFDRHDVLEILLQRVGADFQFEDAMATCFEHLLGFGDVAGGVAAGQGPGHFKAVSHAAAKQLADRQTEALALGIEQCTFDAGLGESIALGDLVEPLHRRVDVVGVHTHQRRRQMRIDIGFDAFRAFITVSETADGGGFADAFNAIAAAQSQNHQSLLLHRVHRQFVRANGRQVDDDGRQVFNQNSLHFNVP